MNELHIMELNNSLKLYTLSKFDKYKMFGCSFYKVNTLITLKSNINASYLKIINYKLVEHINGKISYYTTI